MAVEEHFYFGLVFCLWLGTKYNWLRLELVQEKPPFGYRPGQIEGLIGAIMLLCLALRIFCNLHFPEQTVLNFVMTHLRIDSLLAGVLVAYLYYFKIHSFRASFAKYRVGCGSIAVLGISWTPFVEPIPSVFAKTIGFTLLYLAFGIVLAYFLLTDAINRQLDALFTKGAVNAMSKIGYCSYSIYIIHSFIIDQMGALWARFPQYQNHYTDFVWVTGLSIGIGILMTHYLERYFLKIRDKYYPNRAM